MNEFKKCSVVMLPNEGEAGLGSIYKCKKLDVFDGLTNVGNLVVNRNTTISKSNDYWEAQHLYVCSDDEIKDNDVVLHDCNDEVFIGKIKIHNDDTFTIADGEYTLDTASNYYIKKLIATTDKSLKLPEIDERFLKEFCDKDGIWEIEVEYGIEEDTTKEYNNGQPTFCYPELTNNAINIKHIKQTWTREEVTQLCIKAFNCGVGEYDYSIQQGITCMTAENWIKQNL